MNFVTLLGRTLLLAAAVVSLWLMGCGGDGGELVGRWIYLNGSKDGPTNNMELFKDGTGVSDGNTIKWKVENKRFTIQSTTIGVACDYKVSGSRLTLTYDNNTSAEFVNKENLVKEIEKITTYFTDSRNGQKYRAVTIGGKTWMAQNLNYQTGISWCYDDDNSNCDKYGRLYDWNTAKTACPSEWHLPSSEEWDNLVAAAGGDAAGRVLKSVAGWNKDGNGVDGYGFSALPGGERTPRSVDPYGYGLVDEASFIYSGEIGYWWTATENGGGFAFRRGIYYDKDGVGEDKDYSAATKRYGSSLRCVKDASVSEKSEQRAVSVKYGKLTDRRDGQKYKTLKIGNQVWMAENLRFNVGGSWCYENSPDSCAKYGRLYDWATALTVCPAGWHLPSRREWGDLAIAAGGTGEYGSGGTAGTKLKSTSGWNMDNGVSGNGTDDYGFSALPGGSRLTDGSFGSAGEFGLYWTASEYGSGIAYYRFMYYYDGVDESTNDNGFGFSVLCLQD